jgi:hypothetical protein
MRAENLQEVIHATPFRPFRLCLADGTRVEVTHPDFIASPPGSRTAVVFGRNDSLKIIDVGPVLAVDIGAPTPAGSISPPTNGGE